MIGEAWNARIDVCGRWRFWVDVTRIWRMIRDCGEIAISRTAPDAAAECPRSRTRLIPVSQSPRWLNLVEMAPTGEKSSLGRLERKGGVWCVASKWRRGEDGEILSNWSVVFCMYRGNGCRMAVVRSGVGVEGL